MEKIRPFTIVFRKYDLSNKLDLANKKLYKNSKGRFEIMKSKIGRLYMLDYDETGRQHIIRSYKEINELLRIFGIDFKELESDK